MKDKMKNLYVKNFGNAMQKVARHKALGEDTGSAGGFLVPEELVLEFDEGLKEFGIFHNLCWRQPMKSSSCHIPRIDLNAAHATGSSPLYGGLTLNWTQEGVAATETQPAFSDSHLVAKELIATVDVSNQLVQDGGEALGTYLLKMFLHAIEWTVERECFSGNGVGKPAGIVTSPASVLVTRSSALHVTTADMGAMVRSLLPACYSRAIWCAHPTALEDIVGITGYQVNSGTDFGALCGQVYGRPLYATEKLSAIGTKGDVVLFDPMLYVLGTRELEILASPHINFASNMTTYRAVWRGDGQTIPKGTITLQNGATVVGGFVVLN